MHAEGTSPILMQELLKLVWVNRLYGPSPLRDREDRRIDVIDPGQINPGEGPPILGAQLEIDGTRYNGPLALHVRSSHWREQLRHIDMAYEGCILHVVEQDDAIVCRLNGTVIPTVTIRYPDTLATTYRYLTGGEENARECARTLAGMEAVNRYHLLTRLMIERLQRKYGDFLKIYEESGNNWNEVFYVMLFRTMGAGRNREAYTCLARKVSYSNLCRVRESLLSAEALLLGAAGLLETEARGRFPDPYTLKLQQEGDHLCRRFGIQPLSAREWDTSRSRSSNHPAVRIAELAALLCSREFIFSCLIECTDVEQIRKILSAEASEYWSTHYVPSRRSGFGTKRIGRMMQDILIINLVVPMLFTYGKVNGDDLLQERALEILEKVEAEDNTLVRHWQRQGIAVESAFFSQALIQLSREYCEKKRCAGCPIGKILLCSPEKPVPLADIL